MDILPNVENVIIPVEKFTEYALHPLKGKGKAYAFEKALGYNLYNACSLINNIRKNIMYFEPTIKGDNGFGIKYEVIMELTGANGKLANVLTSWIVEHGSNETRLTSAYVTNRRRLKND